MFPRWRRVAPQPCTSNPKHFGAFDIPFGQREALWDVSAGPAEREPGDEQRPTSKDQMKADAVGV
ncbi:MAG: hypothetical protein WBN70_07270 [Polyangiales bacterium]